jgi:hypothetical protein
MHYTGTYVIILFRLLGPLSMYGVRLSGQVPSSTQGTCAQGTEGSFCRLDFLKEISLYERLS